MTLTYSIELFSYWHAGSGLQGGSDAHTTVIKDRDGLPFLPGKTLKGLLRDAAQSLQELGDDKVTAPFVSEVFGGKNTHYAAQKKVHSSFFTDAYLGDQVRQQLRGQTPDPMRLRAMLFDRLASTAIDERGQAQQGTLRQMEVVVPLTLYAMIHDFPDSATHRLAITRCMQWVKHLGVNRTRGLGRCQLMLLPDS